MNKYWCWAFFSKRNGKWNRFSGSSEIETKKSWNELENETKWKLNSNGKHKKVNQLCMLQTLNLLGFERVYPKITFKLPFGVLFIVSQSSFQFPFCSSHKSFLNIKYLRFITKIVTVLRTCFPSKCFLRNQLHPSSIESKPINKFWKLSIFPQCVCFHWTDEPKQSWQVCPSFSTAN